MTSGPRIEPPFPRTTCACRECTNCCRTQPGSLLPGDAERIAEYLGVTLEAMEGYLWASPGALVEANDGRRIRVGTVTPKKVSGKCIFLTNTGKCRIHPVAPVGCAYMDTHMGSEEGQEKGMWVVKQQVHPEYQTYRLTLVPAGSHHPRIAF